MKTLVMVLACALPLAAQQENSKADSAKADAVVARHTAAAGGLAAFNALKYVHAVMVMTMPGTAGSPEARTEMYMKSPNLVYMKMDVPGLGPMQMGYDGKTAWSTSAATGPVLLDDVPQQLLNAGNFNGPPLQGLKGAYAGRREVGSATMDVLKVLLPDGQRGTFYFDSGTGLLAGMDPEGAPPPPPGRMTVSFHDYTRRGGILHASRVVTIAEGKEMVMRTESMSHAPFDEKIFAPPPEVQKLLEKKPQQR